MDQSTFNHGKSGDTNPKGRSRSPLLELYTRSLRSEREQKIGHRTSAACGGSLRLWYTLDEGKEAERETSNCPPKRVRSSSAVLLAPPQVPRPGLSSRASGRSCVRPPRRPVPCCIGLPLICMPSSLPRWHCWVRTSLASPEAAAFPDCQAARLPRPVFRGLLNVHSRPAYSPSHQSDPLHRRLQSPSLCNCSDCYRPER